MQLNPRKDYDDNFNNQNIELKDAEVFVKYTTSAGQKATLSFKPRELRFLSVYPAFAHYKFHAENWGGIRELEIPESMALYWEPEYGFKYQIKVEEFENGKEPTMNDFERKALAEAARDANSKLQRAKRQEAETTEVLEAQKKQTEKALERYNALKKYEEKADW